MSFFVILLAFYHMHSVFSGHVEYSLVIDAGSSHTGFTLFNYTVNDQGLPGKIYSFRTCEAKEKSVADFKEDLDGLKDYLKNCLKAFDDVLKENKAKTKIYLGATGSMRMMNKTDSASSTAIMAKLNEILASSGFAADAHSAQIIEGGLEGVYAWITSNVKAGNIGLHVDRLSTSGILDMGGTGSQIAYECDSSSNCGSDSFTEKLYGQTYTINSYSDTCYGLETALKRYVVQVIYQSYLDHDLVIMPDLENLCMSYKSGGGGEKLLRDDWLVTFPNKKSALFDTPCTRLNDDGFQAALNELPEDYTWNFLPSYNNRRGCFQSIDFITEKSSCESLFGSLACFDRDRFPTPSKDPFVAVSSYYWEFARFCDVKSGSGLPGFKAVYKMMEICSAKVDPKEKPKSETDCWMVSYIYRVLTEVYGFKDGNLFGDITYESDAANSWALGYLVTLLHKDN